MPEANSNPNQPPSPGATPDTEAPFQIGKGLNPMLLGSLGIIFTGLALLIFYLIKFQRDEAAAKRRTEALLAMQAEDDRQHRREANVVGGMRRNIRRRVNRDQDDGFMQAMAGDDDDEMAEEEDVGPSFEFDENGKKIGKRKAAKLQAKEEKRQQREYDLREREERKRREVEKEAEREKEREKERLEEEAEEERKRKEKEEREKRELEEYLALKESFAVEEEGYDEVEGEEAENLMRDFVEYVKSNKVVNMDELSAHFGFRSEECVQKLQYFLESGQLEGVMDDRGKFIYISDEEFEAVAKFINQRGRVSIAELVEYSNKLIRLDAAA
ncbi:hypothetical protein WR25_08927 [Diploscapter pachys]|uniref:DDRGK domain-containing protein 1 n=1 Tax=Diploscapter pachys TaxID=2018661 RepID=A0A2A2LS80_9BILA|nr:hypothetical protein WR25_08927 [Diploscapter pachys]